MSGIGKFATWVSTQPNITISSHKAPINFKLWLANHDTNGLGALKKYTHTADPMNTKLTIVNIMNNTTKLAK